MEDPNQTSSATDKIPFLYIQCDWDDFIHKNNAEVWISSKYRGETSTHGKLRGRTGSLPQPDTDVFSVLSCDQTTIWIQHGSGFSCLFVAPNKVFSKIHKKSVMSIDASEGGIGVSVCSENKLSVWDAESGELRRLLTGHVCDVYKCKLFPSGIVVLSGGADMQLKIWSAETGICPVTLKGHKAAITDVCMVDKGRNIISVSKDGTAKLWDCGEAKCLGTILELDVGVVINCCDIGTIPDTAHLGERKIEENEREVGTKNKLLLIGTETGDVYGISVYLREIMFSIKTESAVNDVKFISDSFVVGLHTGQVIVYNTSQPQTPIKFWYESNSPVLSLCPYKDMGAFVGRNDGSVTYLHTKPNDFHETRIQLTGSDCDPVYCISMGGDTIFTGCRDGKVRSYNVNNMIRKIYNV